MKILQLNVWMGKVEGGLKRFLENHDFDVICMQEVFASCDNTNCVSYLCFDLSKIKKASRLPYAFFSPHWSFDLANSSCQRGNLILSRIPFVKTNSIFTNGAYREHAPLDIVFSNTNTLQIIELENGFTVVNHHGFWRPNPIGDSETVRAFTKVADTIRGLNGPLVMCGDFNIIHKSPAMRQLDFLRDLTYENGITTSLSGLGYDGEVACDHILINVQVQVTDFTVYPDLVSDHLALSADVELF